jgi:hypothetical protein
VDKSVMQGLLDVNPTCRRGASSAQMIRCDVRVCQGKTRA